jgi:sugar O-acyltransferase (sialic acid O-acetyltransferase NeuD family)
VIVGAGGFGREVFAAVAAINHAGLQFEVLGFIDDGDPDPDLLQRLGARLVGDSDGVFPSGTEYVIGIGDPATRRRIDAKLTASGLSPCRPIVHPRAWIGPDVVLGLGTVVCAGASVTTNVRIGRHVHVNPNATIGHDCRIGDFVTITPLCAVSGSVTLEDEVELGAASTILPGLRVGRSALVGAGAVVTKDVNPRVVVVGVPARPRSAL